MSELVFEEPPRVGSGDYHDHQAAAQQLRENPGQWAVVARYEQAATSGSIAQAVRTGRLTAYTPAGAFEGKARTVNGEHRVYARFVGEGEG